MVPEMFEIDDFFNNLNPYVEVIWGISTDNTIGEDAKVTILATGMEEEQNIDDEQKDDAYYEGLISQLYRPITKPIESPVSEPEFVVEPAPEPEPHVAVKPSMIKDKVRDWITNFLKDTDD
jgi:cell division protein FtsZ